MGHIITPGGVRPNPHITEAVQEFPVPRDLTAIPWDDVVLPSFYSRICEDCPASPPSDS